MPSATLFFFLDDLFVLAVAVGIGCEGVDGGTNSGGDDDVGDDSFFRANKFLMTRPTL